MSQNKFDTEFFHNDLHGIDIKKDARTDDKALLAKIAAACLLLAVGIVIGGIFL